MSENVLKFTFLANDKFTKTARDVERSTDSLGSKIGKFGKFAGTALVGVGTAMAGLGAAGAVLGVKTAASLEQAQIGFATLLHSGQKAQTFLKGLTAFAASTPFELSGLIESSRTLIGVGLSTKQTQKALQDFGDAASAVGVGQEAFQRIMLATSQAISAGKFMAGDLNQIATNGIPIWKILSESMHKTVPELRDLASHGKLLSKDVLPALQSQMHKDYGGAMAKQSATLNGLWSTFTDTLSLGLAKAITPMIPALKTGLAGASVVAGKALEKLPGILDTMTGAFKTSRDFVTKKLVPTLTTAFDGIGDHLPKLDLTGWAADIEDQAKDWGGLILLGVQVGMQTGNWGELGRILGDGLGKALNGAAGAGKSIGKAIGNLFGSIDWLELGKKVGLTAAPFAIGFSLTLVDGLFKAIKEHPFDVALAIVSFIPLGKLFAAFKPLRFLLEKLPFGKWVGAALDRSAVPVFDAAWNFVKFLGRGMLTGIREVIPGMEKMLGLRLGGLIEGVRFQGRIVALAARDFVWGLATGAGRGIGRVVLVIGRVVRAVTWPFRAADRWLINAGRDVVGGLVRGTVGRLMTVGQAAGQVINRITSPFRRAGSWLYQSGREVLRGLRDGMFNGVQAAGSWAANIGGRIVRAVKNFFGIKSPSKVFAGIGSNLIRSLFGSMIDHNPVAAVTKIFGGMPQALGALVNKSLVDIKNLPDKALNALSGLGGKFAGLFGFGGGGGGLSGPEKYIIMHESGGRTNAQNPTSTAFGLGQLIYANRAHYGRILGVSPNTTNYAAQLKMFRMYVHERYGNATNAANFWRAHHWYDQGGIATGQGFMAKNTLSPERVLSPAQTRSFDRLTRVLDRRPAASTASAGADIDYDRMAKANVRAFAQAGIAVKMDGRAVGQIIGRQADLYGRTS
jgi:tape measure domain-containing protein